ncbi:hypothetical protein LXA43DRAFT_630609 [Ganoderma leucocontextum]|nr:hypothetical protein LXA43DRAFT_630609 [Ganoderma leucocontextum]
MTYRGKSTHFQRAIFITSIPKRAMPLARWPCSNHREGLVPHGRRLLLTPFSVPGESAGSNVWTLGDSQSGEIATVDACSGPMRMRPLPQGPGKRAESHDCTAPNSTRLPLNNPKPAVWLPTSSAITKCLARPLLLRTETRGRGRLKGDLQPCVSHLYRAIEIQTEGAFTAAVHKSQGRHGRSRVGLAALGTAGTLLLQLSR